MAEEKQTPVILALTGASGVQYALRLMECLLDAGTPVYLMVSKAAQIVLSMETELKVPAKSAEMARFFTELYKAKKGQLEVFSQEQWTAPIASGSHKAQSMVVCPCTTGTLAAIANGNSDNLLERAADVMLKEKRQLIMVVRETPFSQIHLENMLRLSQAGATIMPANPGFYHKPEKLEDIIDFIVSRILDHLKIEHSLLARWGE
ncbi:MAG: UbiX family flavin prenyltransferase [Gammaproteobacteria bacterium]|nr:UbiX family flavin prenyltransferase [Gammaproteobacteria bacterium]